MIVLVQRTSSVTQILVSVNVSETLREEPAIVVDNITTVFIRVKVVLHVTVMLLVRLT